MKKLPEKPVWLSEPPPSEYPTLTGKIKADVAVVGGGITGILSAYLLSKAGKKVAVFEKKRIGSDTTAYTTAFLTHTLDTGASELIELCGLPKAKHLWRSHAQAIDLIEQIIKKEKIECEFVRCPAYLYASSPKQMKYLADEYKAIRKLGFDAELQETRIKLPNQAKFHPLKFLYGLSKKLGPNVKIFEHREVAKLEDIERFAKDIIIATYQPMNNPWSTFMKKGMYTSYVLEAHIPPNTFEESINMDFSNPYYYYRVDHMGKYDRIIIGGADHREEIPMNEEKAYAAILRHLSRLLRKVPFQIVRRWTGPILEPVDGIALIGAYELHRYVATAFSGNGMTYAGIAAMLFRDAIKNKENPYASLYSPKRNLSLYQLVKKGKDYVGEFIGGAVKNTL